ncbi:MAG: glutaredoxin family protein [Promethearchaeota archaeon]
MSDLIEKHAKKVEGSKKVREITIITLSTCMWCKKCKRWLEERDIQYKFIDIDKILHEDKKKILDFLKSNYKERVSYPFMIYDDDNIMGYDPGKYEKLLKGGGS